MMEYGDSDSNHDSSIKTARTKGGAAFSFCPFEPAESFLVAKVSIGASALRAALLASSPARRATTCPEAAWPAGPRAGPARVGLPTREKERKKRGLPERPA